MTPAAWRPDILDGFEACELPLTRGVRLEGETDLVATLVRRTLDADPARDLRRRAVLSLPGWNDYFFHRHVAEFFERRGFTVYALDPRRSGRSLRDPQFRDYVTDLSDFFEEYDAAHAVISATHGAITLLAHSTGGLVGSLWAGQRPGALAGVVLNSPWLAMWGFPGYGTVLIPPISVLATRDPRTQIKLPDPKGRYRDCVHSSANGEWDYDQELKSPGPIPVRAGWLRAVLLGHRKVAAGLGIQAPVFVGCSTRSFLNAREYSERARTSDIVLDVDSIAAKAPRLGSCVTLVRVPNGFHDLSLSVPAARETFFFELGRWLTTYVPDAVPL